MSWYRKYRPLQFSDLVGQDHISQILCSALQKEALVHAYLFSGPRGTGKTSTARILGKALNCLRLKNNGEPCNTCEHCQEINEGRFVDLIEIDAASNTGVDHIRDLRDKIGFSPTSGKAKVYIIDEVHMLSTGAFNALLKTLEEPPNFVYFILATTEIHKVPETIQSRCQRFSFRHLLPADIVKRLQFIAEQENVDAQNDALEIIAHQAAGGLRDAISLLEQHAVSGSVTMEALEMQMGLVPEVVLQEFLTALTNRNAEEALLLLDRLSAEGLSLSEFVRGFFLLLRKGLRDAAKQNISATDIILLLEIFEEAQKKIRFALIPQLPLEVAVVKAVEALSDTEEVQSKSIFSIFSGEKEKQSDVVREKEKKLEKEKAEEKNEEQGEESSANQTKQPQKYFSAEFTAPELSREGIKQAMPQIIERLENSLLRMALRNAEIMRYEKNVLELQFPAAIWKEKLENTENMQQFLQAFSDIFSQKISVTATVEAVQLEPTVAEKAPAANTEQQSQKPSPVEMLEEIMGAKAVKEE